MELLKKHLPRPLREYDRKLLLKRPAVWAVQFHTLAFWAVALMGLSALLALVAPVSLENIANNNTGAYFGIAFGVLAAVLLVGWAWLQRSHIVEEQFGDFSLSLGRYTLFSYLGGFLLLSMPIMLPQAILDYRYAQLVSDEQFSQDIETLNKYQLFFPVEHYDELNYYEAQASGFDHFSFEMRPFKNPLGTEKPVMDNTTYSSNEEKNSLALNLTERIVNSNAEQTQAYIEAAQRYIGEKEFNPDPQEALEQFKAGEAIYGNSYYYHLSRRLNALGNVKGSGYHHLLFSSPSMILGWLLGVFGFAHLALIFRYIGLKQSLISFAINALAISGIGMTGAMLGMFGVGISGIALMILLPILFFASLRIIGRSTRPIGKKGLHPWSLAILGAGHFYAVYFIQIAFGIGMYILGRPQVFVSQYTGTGVPLVIGGTALIIAFSAYILLPMFHRAYLRIKAAPESA